MSRATADSPTRHLPGGTRAFLMRQFRLWHWVSAALSLTGLLMFAATGITLNHPALIPSTPVTTEVGAQLPQDLQRLLQDWPDETEDPLPDEISRWTRQELALNIAGRATETDPEEVYIPLPRPGGDSWLSIARDTGAVLHRQTDRGWVAYLNDLHKGRDAGPIWSLFIDLLAAACIVFSLTGLGLLWLHGRDRPATWPLTSASLLLPVLLALLFIH